MDIRACMGISYSFGFLNFSNFHHAPGPEIFYRSKNVLSHLPTYTGVKKVIFQIAQKCLFPKKVLVLLQITSVKTSRTFLRRLFGGQVLPPPPNIGVKNFLAPPIPGPGACSGPFSEKYLSNEGGT